MKLIAACWLGDEAMVHSLRTNHPNIAGNLTDADRRQVARAARNNETTVVRLLLESGLPLDAGHPAPGDTAPLGRISRQRHHGQAASGPQPTSGSQGRRFSFDPAGVGHPRLGTRLALPTRETTPRRPKR